MAKYSIIEVNNKKPKNSLLKAVSFEEKEGLKMKFRHVLCQCDCGNTIIVRMTSVINGHTISCGCIVADPSSDAYKRIKNRKPRSTKYTIPEINSLKHPDCKLQAIKVSHTKRFKNGNSQRMILCRCICGNKLTVNTTSLISGHTCSCGCLSIEKRVEKVRKYINNVEAIHFSYFSMMNRCYDPKCDSYKHYGAIGVVVCKEWKENYQTFLDWSLANGWKKGLQLDKDIKYVKMFPEAKTGRIYSPEFCSWVTALEHSTYKRNTIKIEYYGEMVALADIARKVNIRYGTLASRLKRMNIYDAIKFNK